LGIRGRVLGEGTALGTRVTVDLEAVGSVRYC
jgi:hypothetical protein